MANAPVVAPAAPSAPAAPITNTPGSKGPGGAAPAPSQKVTNATAAGTQAQVSAVKGMSPAEAKAVMHEIKVNGETQSIPYEVMVALAQKGYAADGQFKTAAEAAKRIKAAGENFKNDPEAAFKEFGMDADEWAAQRTEAWLKKQMEEAALSPEAKKIRDLEKKLAEKEASDKASAIKEDNAKFAAETKVEVTKEGKLLFDAVEASSLPHTDETAELMRTIRLATLDQGLDLNPAQLVYLAEQADQQRAQRQLQALAKSDKQKLLRFLGPDILKAINEADIEAVASRPGSPDKAIINRQDEKADAKDKPKKKYMSDSKLVKATVAAMMGPRGSRAV